MQMQKDKLTHFVVGAIVAGAAAAAAQMLGTGPGQRAAAGLVAAIAVGAGRELWQRATGRGTPDAADAMATVAGGALAAAAMLGAAP